MDSIGWKRDAIDWEIPWCTRTIWIDVDEYSILATNNKTVRCWEGMRNSARTTRDILIGNNDWLIESKRYFSFRFISICRVIFKAVNVIFHSASIIIRLNSAASKLSTTFFKSLVNGAKLSLCPSLSFYSGVSMLLFCSNPMNYWCELNRIKREINRSCLYRMWGLHRI